MHGKNARADAHARKILKCSKWSETYPKNFWRHLEHFFCFNARVRARNDARADCHGHGSWPLTWSLYVPNIGHNWLTVMKIWLIRKFYKMAPRWRHGWVITMKSLTAVFQTMPNNHGKFHGHWHCRYWDKRDRKTWEEIRINNNKDSDNHNRWSGDSGSPNK